MDLVWVQPPPSPVTAKTLSRCLWMGWGHAHRWGSPWELSRRRLPQGLVGTVTLPALKEGPRGIILLSTVGRSVMDVGFHVTWYFSCVCLPRPLFC